MSAEVILSNDTKLVKKLAPTLKLMNKERQKLEYETASQASEIVNTNYSQDTGIVLYDENWHSGVVDIFSWEIVP
jgi:single-stranded DNA-specific DHH superfamily exonuclease